MRLPQLFSIALLAAPAILGAVILEKPQHEKRSPSMVTAEMDSIGGINEPIVRMRSLVKRSPETPKQKPRESRAKGTTGQNARKESQIPPTKKRPRETDSDEVPPVSPTSKRKKMTPKSQKKKPLVRDDTEDDEYNDDEVMGEEGTATDTGAVKGTSTKRKKGGIVATGAAATSQSTGTYKKPKTRKSAEQ